MQAEHAVDAGPFRRLKQPVMRHAHRMQRAFQLALPEIQKLLEAGKERRQVVILPDELLQQLGMVGHVVVKLEGYGLTTAEIHYHMPDHPKLLQQFIWQDYDLAPLFPGLKQFLDFWQRELEGALHAVRVAHSHLIRPSEWKRVDGLFRLN